MVHAAFTNSAYSFEAHNKFHNGLYPNYNTTLAGKS